MPDLKPEVIEAFQTLNLDINAATFETAAKAYKTQAIRHHPDKNPGDPAATQRFQKLGAAWDICQAHFEDPESSYVNSRSRAFDIDPEDLAAYFMFLFEEAIRERYQTRRNYHGGRGGPQFVFSSGGRAFGFSAPSASYYSSSYSYSGDYSGNRQLKQADDHNERQARDRAEYEKRLKEFEQQIEQEKREIHRLAMEKSKNENERAEAYQQAFQAARTGDAPRTMRLVEGFDLDVNAPERTSKNLPKKSDKPTNFQTLLHSACRSCDEGLIIFLLDRGAIPDALNDAKLTPFHVAILCGNIEVVKFFLLRRVHGKPTPGCHPSKAAADGRTPLQLAILSRNAEIISLMTQQATVHDVERCWLLPDATSFKDILLEKKGFVDPEIKEMQRQEEQRKAAEERAREVQRVADEKLRQAEKARLKEEKQRRAAEQRALEEQKRREEAELARKRQEAEERKAELERKAAEARRRQEQEAAEAKRRAEQEAAAMAAELRRQAEETAAAARRKAQQEAAEARRRAQAEQEATEARLRAERAAAEARRQAEEAEASRQAAEREQKRLQGAEDLRRKKAAKAETRRLQREAETATARQQAEAEARRRVAAMENTSSQQGLPDVGDDRAAAAEQRRIDQKRAETLRRLQAQAEEHRRMAEAKARTAEVRHVTSLQPEEPPQRPKLDTQTMVQSIAGTIQASIDHEQRRKLPKKHQPRDVSQLSAEELQKRAAQSARDKARIAEDKRRKMQELAEHKRSDTPENEHRTQFEDYIPPTPISMPSPSQRRLSPPLIPHHTRPNVAARKMDPQGVVLLGAEDIQTGAIADELFAREPPGTNLPLATLVLLDTVLDDDGLVLEGSAQYTFLPSEPASLSKPRRDPPPALDIAKQPQELTERDIARQPSVLVTPTDDPDTLELDYPPPRSASATSSLDPYYFGLSDSPVPPLPTAPVNLSTTPDQLQPSDPVTPARDPALIDRRGLVGVGELTTPRWTRAAHSKEDTITPVLPSLGESFEDAPPEEEQPDAPDSPWTIEAVDGEMSEREELPDVNPTPRTLRERPSITEESGGEEILYPRKLSHGPPPALPQPSQLSEGGVAPIEQPASRQSHIPPPLDLSLSGVQASQAPSSFSQQRRAKKRTSDEFEMDQFGALVSKRVGSSKDKPSKEEKTSVRKHRSLNVGSPNKTKERRRDSSGLAHSGSLKLASSPAKASEKHSRHASTSSSSSSHAETTRRVHTTDFSHLPPSPSSSSILSFLKHPGPGVSQTPPLVSSAGREFPQSHPSPNVAHSLLRGTQEGWSGLDDEATAEALRKLDGLSGKSARARASVASFTRSTGSRPGTPAKSATQWEGIGPMEPGRRASATSQHSSHSKERPLGGSGPEGAVETELIGSAVSSDEQPFSPSNAAEKTPKKGTASARSSFTPKRGSTSSTTYASTPTTSSRDSASMSVTTTATSVSAASSRHSMGKARRNSAGSDVSSIHSSDATSLKDRVASLASNGDAPEDTAVPPVPPLPKDLSTYRSPPPTSAGLTFPVLPTPDEDRKRQSHESEERPHPAGGISPLPTVAVAPPTVSNENRRRSQHYSGYTSQGSGASDSTSAVPKTPSKKWSFSNALNLRLSSSPSSAAASSPKSPRSVTFGQQLRKSTSKDQTLSPVPPNNPWEQPAAMSSAASLASLSSVGSVRSPGLRPPSSSKTSDSKSSERGPVLSRTGTDSSASTTQTTSALAPTQSGPLSPTSSVRRNQSKRLTPSSIPFFRRSSSQSMQIPATIPMPSSPTQSTSYNSLVAQPRTKPEGKHDSDYNPSSTSTPGKKSSVLSLLKSSSRRSLHADSKEAARELQRMKDAEKEKEKEKERLAKAEKERLKKEEKDRSESRISVLMGRKRGKTLSSTDPPPRKQKSPVHLPPLQMAALEPVTAQRVARLKSTPSASSTPSSTPSSTTRTVSGSRLTSQTVSSMQKQSDSSLRSRNALPTIAGSPSVASGANGSSKEGKEPPPSSSLSNSVSGSLPKETPTKIPRISSRTSTVGSPLQKGMSRRTSVNASGLSSSTNPSPTGVSTNEFGVLESDDSHGAKTVSAATRNASVRASPATVSTSRVPRQSSTNATASSSSSVLTRKPNRDSISFTGLRKSSTSSVTSSSTATAAESSSTHHRFSALSPSRGLNKLLSPKIGIARASNSSSSIQQVANSPSSSRQSLSAQSPSPAPSSVDDEEALGDEEMMHYIRRQQAKKMAAGATQEELDELLKFPEPKPPGTPSTPQAILKGSQTQHLSEFERKEILDYPNVYCIGAKSNKKPAVLENSTNNYGYDDDRGDYLVVNRDHLAYRYEVMDTLGKGSFGQVLSCRDHCTGESVAIKIIRNKKRFHHQALVEIKILDNLRKWDAEEKHHVIKMTEHFYFRGHLCIAMELLSINLYELIKANGFVGFTTTLIRRFTTQMLMSLSLMRHHRIVHCDLKPENVLLRHPAKSALKVIDFGSSCLEHEKIYTYIQSRFYRSPEVILGMNYHMAIDMWSLGCILAELYTGFPIFPGENEQEQLSCIMEVLGVPDKEFVNRSSRKKLFFDPNGAPRAVINSKGRRRRPGTKTLAQVLRCNDDEFVDFIAKCLIWDPERRIKPQAALRHPFVLAGKRGANAPSSTTPKAPLSSSTLGSSRTKQVLETPKKERRSYDTQQLVATFDARLLAIIPSVSGSGIIDIPFEPDLERDSGVRRAHQSSSPELTHLLQRYASSPSVPLDLANLLSFGRPVTPTSVLSSVQFAIAEIPRRLAKRARSLETLPYLVGTNPYVAKTLDAYRDSFRLLTTYPAVTTVEENQKFTEQLENLVHRHTDDIPTMAKGFLECAKYMSPTQMSNFLDGMIRNRISVRLIAEQHIAISRALENAQQEVYVGIVDTQCSPSQMIRMCESYVAELCSATLGSSPSIVIDGHPETTFAYVPVHLEYILTEILKNSFRATVEFHKARTLPPVRITLSPPMSDSTSTPTSSYLSIRIRDEGGGVSPTNMARIFSYAFSTARSSESDVDGGGGPYAAQHIGGLANIGGADLFSEITSKGLQTGLGSIAGLGYGLPMSKLYAEYFGGSLDLMSLDGWGSDTFLRLRCLNETGNSTM
ncbi:CMGC/DYRK/DYRK2 protein kinase [Favolaschia claudopus]|uniref:dual-specificity kinase n=1 Tax=Favolaschia claudopus TaxID=2862362 RepID=A0AAW0BEI2_9AGAR